MHNQMLSIDVLASAMKIQAIENKEKDIFTGVWSAHLKMNTRGIHSIDRLLGPCQSGFNS
jgi:hypothetical protein